MQKILDANFTVGVDVHILNMGENLRTIRGLRI